MITKPFTIFIDTSIFESENFFQGRNLRTLCELTKSKIVELKITDIIYEELKQRIRANVTKAQTSTKKSLQVINGEGKILKNIPQLKDLYSLLNINLSEIENELLTQLNIFLEYYHFEIINSKISNVNEVFHDYFQTKPPFKEGSKKNEFPDAFSINTIKKWAEINNEKIIFLTNDSDFLELSIKNIDNTHSISSLLDFITRHTNEIHTDFIEKQNWDYNFDYEIRDALENNFDLQLRQAVEEEIFIYSDYYEPEIDDLENYEATIESKDINSIDLNKNVIFEVRGTITFNTNLSYYEISNAIYDKEDDEWYGKESKDIKETFSATIVCLAKFNYNLSDDFFEFAEITYFEVEKIEEV